ncbi:MAG: amylo-alpha-1,6-glucosidase [Actinomycetota bacterium]
MHLALGATASRSPLLQEDIVALSAPTQAWSRRDGVMDGPTHGLFHGAWRWVRSIELRVDGQAVEHRSTTEEHGWTVFRSSAPALDGGDATDSVLVERMRGVEPGGLVERVTLVNNRDVEVTATVELIVELELAPIASVRDGAPKPVAIGLSLDAGAAVASDGVRTLRCASTRGTLDVTGHRVTASRTVVVQPGDWSTLAVEIEIDDPHLAARGPMTAALPALRTTGRAALDRWTARAAADLEDLSLDVGHGPFAAAAAPWQMTLLARDALIAARLTLPSGAAIAEGTLRTLATRQGVLLEPATGEEPGRIPDELSEDGPVATAVFGASVDATPLWIVLLHEAWLAGMSTEGVREARTALHAALRWLSTRTGDTFLADTDDGPRAAVQAIAFRAAMGAADLLDALGDDGDRWRAWARQLRDRFREAFWIDSGAGRRPVTALDRDGAPDDRLGAELGELVGTGLLDADEEAVVIRILLDDRMASRFGLRALADDGAEESPELGVRDAVRPHQTGIAIEGMLRAGFRSEARVLAERLLAGAEAFEGRLPAAFGVDDVEGGAPLPLRGMSSLHAASAASAMVAHRVLDVPPAPKRHLAAVERLEPMTGPARTGTASMRLSRSSSTGGSEQRPRVRLRLVEPEA